MSGQERVCLRDVGCHIVKHVLKRQSSLSFVHKPSFFSFIVKTGQSILKFSFEINYFHFDVFLNISCIHIVVLSHSS